MDELEKIKIDLEEARWIENELYKKYIDKLEEIRKNKKITYEKLAIETGLSDRQYTYRILKCYNKSKKIEDIEKILKKL